MLLYGRMCLMTVLLASASAASTFTSQSSQSSGSSTSDSDGSSTSIHRHRTTSSQQLPAAAQAAGGPALRSRFRAPSKNQLQQKSKTVQIVTRKSPKSGTVTTITRSAGLKPARVNRFRIGTGNGLGTRAGFAHPVPVPVNVPAMRVPQIFIPPIRIPHIEPMIPHIRPVIPHIRPAVGTTTRFGGNRKGAVPTGNRAGFGSAFGGHTPVLHTGGNGGATVGSIDGVEVQAANMLNQIANEINRNLAAGFQNAG